MISYLEGTVVQRGAQHLIVKTGGVGFKVMIPPSVASGLPVGSTASLHVSLVVRQDALELFGFGSPEDRDFFELLGSLSRVGSRTAFSLVAALGSAGITEAVRNNNPALLASVPGVGEKTAARILLELKNKLESADLLPVADISESVSIAMQALMQLGYSRQEAQAAVQGLKVEPGASVESIVSAALARVDRTKLEGM